MGSTTTEQEAPERVEEVIFRSKGRNFRAVRPGHGKRRYRDDYGEQVIVEGEAVDFAPNGEFRTTNPATVKWLTESPSFNLYFWRVGEEPGAVPSPDAINEQVLSATLELDDERLAALELEEQKSHQRQDVLHLIRAARTRVQGVAAEGA